MLVVVVIVLPLQVFPAYSSSDVLFSGKVLSRVGIIHYVQGNVTSVLHDESGPGEIHQATGAVYNSTLVPTLVAMNAWGSARAI